MESKIEIIIVEDEAIHMMELKSILQNHGYEVFATASTGEKAMKCLENKCPDLAIMDISLNGPLDGLKAAEKMRLNCDFPIVFITGYDDEATAKSMRNISNSIGLIKPISEEDLIQSIQNLLSREQNF